MAQEPSVTRVLRRIPISTINQTQDAAVPAIGILQQHRPIALVRILGADRNEVGRKLHFAILQIDGLVEINDAQVVRIGHRNCEVHSTRDPFVCSRLAKQFPVQQVNARCELHANDACVHRCQTQKNKEERRNCALPGSHARKHSTQRRDGKLNGGRAYQSIRHYFHFHEVFHGASSQSAQNISQ